MNLENKENLSNYQLLKRKPSLCSTLLPFSKLISVVQFFFSRDTDSDMVSIKFWRGKFSRPATGYECIAHAPAFDRGVPNPSPRLCTNPLPVKHPITIQDGGIKNLIYLAFRRGVIVADVEPVWLAKTEYC